MSRSASPSPDPMPRNALHPIIALRPMQGPGFGKGGFMGLGFPGNVVFREEPEGGIVFNVDTGEMRFVEGVARGICRLIDRRRKRNEILSELEARYPEIGSVRLAEDLDDFLSALRASSMLEDS